MERMHGTQQATLRKTPKKIRHEEMVSIKDLILYGKAHAETRPPEPPQSGKVIAAMDATPDADTIIAQIRAERIAHGDILQTKAENPPWLRSLADFPAVVPEAENPNILIRGRWLERGGSAFLVSTAGTGKSIWALQFALSMYHAQPFSGLNAWRPLRTWIIQSEDSDDRVSIDRDDIMAGLVENDVDELGEECREEREAYWREAANATMFMDFTGLTGSTFLDALNGRLALVQTTLGVESMPDVLVINPLLDFLGGDMNRQDVVSGFLSGGMTGQAKETRGLRSILREYNIGAIIVHHTPKPPNPKELQAWIKSTTPEYQAAGSSYITNWGRSFITMMKVPNEIDAVMLTAGKNGSGLGWDVIGGARRRFLVWGGGESSGGTGARHFWTEPSPLRKEQLMARLNMAAEGAGESADSDATTLATYLKAHPTVGSEIYGASKEIRDATGIGNRSRIRVAFKVIRDNLSAYGIAVTQRPSERGNGQQAYVYGPDAKNVQVHDEIQEEFL